MNKVILLGGNHHNGLGLVRSFGRHGIKPYGIIIGNGSEDSFVAKSKFWKKTWSVKTEEDALRIILDSFANETPRPVIIPWSDGAAKIVDTNYDRLSKHFIVPSINNLQGEIFRLMNKEEQILFASSNSLRMLPSKIYKTCEEKNPMIKFPVILKPVTSVEGKKSDMSICFDIDNFRKSINELKAKGFERILVQKYLDTKTEYLLTGSISDRRYSFSLARNIRQWPPNFGTFSFSETETEDYMKNFCCDVLDRIAKAGYRGPIDIEIFKDGNDELYINEFNWRSSGRNFISKHTHVESAYMYYCDIVGIDYRDKLFNDISMCIMNEITDIKHVFRKELSFWRWLLDLKKTRSFAVWDLRDPRPAFKRYRIMISRYLKGEDKR